MSTNIYGVMPLDLELVTKAGICFPLYSHVGPPTERLMVDRTERLKDDRAERFTLDGRSNGALDARTDGRSRAGIFLDA